jgi:acyl-CoA synthetase (AMP-forming)/AMP-acid ligase II/acyl carrier protein
LIVGGEDLKTDLARRIHDAFGGNVEIYNEYGPTETVVGSMIHRYDPEHDTATSVPIGIPVDNTRIYLLDEKLNPVPPGAIGEMYIAGDGVARGYLHREELTRERFLPDPFVPGSRMYRTGDTARWRNEGVMEYCGRLDYQVKIRGHRVELGEIESDLGTHKSIRECVVDVVQKHTSPVNEEKLDYCVACGLASNYPGTTFNDQGRCNQCTAYEHYRQNVEPYFKQIDELQTLFEGASSKRRGDYDCIALLSGGKDSTFVLAQLVEMGLDVLAYTLDNGYISDQAKENIRRVVEELGVDHIFGTTPHMNAIFADSLARHSNVCNGCFKTLYTLSIHLAREKGIPCVVTGLSRGQQFETRLSNFYRSDDFCPDTVDRYIKEARKVYHRLDDEVSRRLDVSLFKEEDIFDEIQIIDFYRYCDVSLEDLYTYLDARLPWVRPSDTGRSTNCLINDVGIYIHKKERRYHNYAMPYAWDVRTRHKERDAALEELDDQIDVHAVRRIMAEIGYNGRTEEQSEPVLTAYYVANEPIEADELRDHLSDRLPEALIPARFIRIDEIPLTPNGKVDRRALAEVGAPTSDYLTYTAPRTPVEQRLVSIWSHVLGLDRVSIQDNFFRLGGHSLLAAQVVASIAQDLHVELPVGVLFDHVTIEDLAVVVAEAQTGQLGDLSELEDILSEIETMTDEEVEGELLRPRPEEKNG